MLIALLAATQALAQRGFLPVAVPELDQTTLETSRIARNQDSAEVETILGKPPIAFDLKVIDATIWRYPVRIPHRDAPLARAALLRVWLDGAERVERWSFLHPLSMVPLAIRESVGEADAWRGHLCQNLRKIELASALKAGTPLREVLEGMRWFGKTPKPSLTERSFVTISEENGKKLLTFYADRPSPLFIPSFYFEVILSQPEQRVRVTPLQGWGGCGTP